MIRAPHEDVSHTLFDSPVGPLFARAECGELTHLSFARPTQTADRSPDGGGTSARVIREVEAQIGEYFAGRRRTFDVPLRPLGPPFHLSVWKALLEIPYGMTMAYGEIAKRIGEPDAARAVGAANGANPIVIIVPCHRVIGADGRLVGYGGGLDRKRFLLDLESGRNALALG